MQFHELEILPKFYVRYENLQFVIIAGGCGASYAIQVEAASFKGLTKVQQHRKVTGMRNYNIYIYIKRIYSFE